MSVVALSYMCECFMVDFSAICSVLRSVMPLCKYTPLGGMTGPASQYRSWCSLQHLFVVFKKRIM